MSMTKKEHVEILFEKLSFSGNFRHHRKPNQNGKISFLNKIKWIMSDKRTDDELHTCILEKSPKKMFINKYFYDFYQYYLQKRDFTVLIYLRFFLRFS